MVHRATVVARDWVFSSARSIHPVSSFASCSPPSSLAMETSWRLFPSSSPRNSAPSTSPASPEMVPPPPRRTVGYKSLKTLNPNSTLGTNVITDASPDVTAAPCHRQHRPCPPPLSCRRIAPQLGQFNSSDTAMRKTKYNIGSGCPGTGHAHYASGVRWLLMSMPQPDYVRQGAGIPE
jgi:hypothetical protein